MADPDPPDASGLTSLPDHIIEHIFSLLTVRGKASLSLTCRRFRDVAQSARVFSSCACKLDVRDHFDTTRPVRRHMRQVDISGPPGNIATALSQIDAAASGTGYTVCRVCQRGLCCV